MRQSPCWIGAYLGRQSEIVRTTTTEGGSAVNEDNIERIVKAFLDARRDSGEPMGKSSYYGLMLSFNAHHWRMCHPEDFYDYYADYDLRTLILSRSKKSKISIPNPDYPQGWFGLPREATQMLIEHVVSYEEVEAAITHIIQLMDKESLSKRPRLTEEQKRIKELEGYVYVERTRESYKIGSSRSPKQRHRRFITENPEEVETVLCGRVIDCKFLERTLHWQFAAKRGHGEWFRLEPADLEVIRELLDEWAYNDTYIQERKYIPYPFQKTSQ
jgi:hypothetical protein